MIRPAFGNLSVLRLLAVIVATLAIEPLHVTEPLHNASCGCPVGNVSDCCCSFAELEQANSKVVYSLLKQIVATPFFGHFRIHMCSKCGLWEDNPMCMLRDCSVCECDQPPSWTKLDHCDEQVDQHVTSIQPFDFGLWKTVAEESSSGDHSSDEVVVDLRENPERFTAYSGESAAKVWNEIHNRNCFQSVGDQSVRNSTSESCMSPAWQRVYNRLISGIHASISLHIAHGYCLKRDPTNSFECETWGPNVSVAWERVLHHPERVENLYATFAVLLRAVVKAGDLVTAAVPREDAEFSDSLQEWRESLLPELVLLAGSCPKTFAEDEFALGGEMWDEVNARLTHLAEIMKCVGCDRCKLWGTLQTQGLSAALRILFQPGGVQSLTRQEAVSLIHTLERLSSSIQYLQEFRLTTPRESIGDSHSERLPVGLEEQEHAKKNEEEEAEEVRRAAEEEERAKKKDEESEKVREANKSANPIGRWKQDDTSFMGMVSKAIKSMLASLGWNVPGWEEL